MPRWMTVIIAIYAVLCLFAIAVGLIGTLGLFGTEPDGLAGVFAIFLGMPWSIWVLPALGSSEIMADIAIVVCMAINGVILAGIGMLFRPRRRFS